ncbi:MAG TPA: hypothetical protein VK656_06830 [Candidatus Acidoferrum sp.]|nr:hypothetical protein [Candidatus Acidoferrum sp.]
MTGIILIGARFATFDLASIAVDRLRRHQARPAGKLRMARLGAAGRIADDVIVAGPIQADTMAEVERIVEELGGTIVARVASD